MALNKMQMYRFLASNGYNCAKSYDDLGEFYKDLDLGVATFPVFVKPICGSASIAISKVEDKETLELIWSKNKGLMIQQFLKGQEIGADCYIDLVSNQVVSIFTKKKLVDPIVKLQKATGAIVDNIERDTVLDVDIHTHDEIEMLADGPGTYIYEENV